MTGKTTKGKKFVKDLGIYTIGNIGSKLVTFLLVPLYTFFIPDPSSFGYYDVCLNTIFCLIPIIGMQLTDGSFRFLIDNKDATRRKDVITFVYKALIRNSLIAIAIGVTVACIFDIKYLWLSIGLGLAQTFYDVMLQVVRGLGHTKRFMTAGIINAFLIAIISFLLIAVLNFGIPGIFISNIASRLLTVAIMDCSLGITRKYFSLKAVNKKLNHEIYRYCLPLIPSALCWWFITGNNLYFLQYFSGLNATGLYGFVGRFTGILYILCFIFYQTWQQNAIEQYNSPDRDEFFSNIFNNYLYLLTGLTICFPFALRLVYPWIIGAEFQTSDQYLFAGSIYVMISALASFFEIGYQCSKQTKRILPSLCIAILINLTCNYFFVQWWSIYGIIFSNILTWIAMLIYRAIDTRKFMKISFHRIGLLTVPLLIIFCIIYQTTSSAISDIISISAFLIVYVIFMPSQFKQAILRLAHHNKTQQSTICEDDEI